MSDSAISVPSAVAAPTVRCEALMIAPAGTVEAIVVNARVTLDAAEAVAFREAMIFVPVPAPAVLVMSVILR